MSYIQQVEMPSGTKYDIMGEDSFAWGGEPILTVSATTLNNTSYYDLVHITPTSACTLPQGPIVFKITTSYNNGAYKSEHFCRMYNTNSLNYSAVYENFNTSSSTTYTAGYYSVYYPSTASNYATMPLKLAVRNNNAGTSGWANTITISIYKVPEGFTVEEGTKAIVTTTSYTRGTEAYLAGNGYQEIGDNNDTDYRQRDYAQRPYAGIALPRYRLCMLNHKGLVEPILTTDQSSATQVTNKQTNTRKLRASTGIYYYGGSSTINAGSVIAQAQLYSAYYIGASFVYSFNHTPAAYTAVYLKGTYDASDDSFQIVNSTGTDWSVCVPNNNASVDLKNYFNSNYQYMLIGYTYNTAGYFSLTLNNIIYKFDGTNLIPAVGGNNYAVTNEVLIIS